MSCVLRSGAGLAAAMIFCTAALADGDAPKEPPSDPTFLFFAGTDLFSAYNEPQLYGAFADAGGIWAPAGLDHDGFGIKLLASGGIYTYPSDGLHTNVRVTQLSGSVLPGWRMNDNDAFIGFYVGPVVQDYKLSPYDPKSLLRGFHVGAQLSVDGWYQPVQPMMLAFDASVASIALIGSARVATGWQISESFFLGPEAQALWCIDYHEWRLGAHITAFRFGGIEWAVAAGAAYDSFNRLGPYLRAGIVLRY
ncbi:MAG TPA: cellulose biosynthesis protein BcsS [Xanthobacteraceae bacterium]